MSNKESVEKSKEKSNLERYRRAEENLRKELAKRGITLPEETLRLAAAVRVERGRVAQRRDKSKLPKSRLKPVYRGIGNFWESVKSLSRKPSGGGKGGGKGIPSPTQKFGLLNH